MRIEIKWGIVIGVFGLLWIIGEKMMGLHGESIDKYGSLTLLVYPFLILFYYLALREIKQKKFKGVMNWEQGVTAGITIAMIVAISTIVTQVFMHYVLSPNFFENIIQYHLNNKLIDTYEKAASYFNFKTFLMLSSFGALSQGILISAILSWLLKKQGRLFKSSKKTKNS